MKVVTSEPLDTINVHLHFDSYEQAQEMGKES